MRQCTAILLAFGVLCIAPAQLSAQSPQGLLLGLLRVDGIALPFARYSEGAWSRLPFDSIPAAFDVIAESWYLLPSRSPAQPMQRLVSGPLVYFDPSNSDSWYEAWGQVTDYAPRSISSGYPAARVGVLLSDSVSATPMRRIEVAPLQQRIVRLLRPAFRRLEPLETARALREHSGVLPTRHPTSDTDRAKTAIQVRQLWRSEGTASGARVLYVVAEKRYPVEGRDFECDAVSLLHGWIVEREERLELITPELILSNGTEMEDRTAEPFALLTIGERDFLIVEWSLYEGTERDVLELSASGVASVLGPPF